MREYVETIITTPFPDEPTVFNIVVGIEPESSRVKTFCLHNGKYMTESTSDIYNDSEWECLLNTIVDVIEDSMTH